MKNNEQQKVARIP